MGGRQTRETLQDVAPSQGRARTDRPALPEVRRPCIRAITVRIYTCYRHVDDVTDIAASSLIPLYTNDRVNRDTLLCELGLYFDSTKAFPDNSLKTDVVLKLVRAGLGGFRVLNAENHIKYFQLAYATLDTYLKHGGRDRLDVFF